MIIAAAVLTIILFAALWKLGRLAEVHHGYFGIAICLIAFGSIGPRWLWLVGLLLLLDDDVQHVAEAFGWVPRMADFTPVHRLGAWVLHFFSKG